MIKKVFLCCICIVLMSVFYSCSNNEDNENSNLQNTEAVNTEKNYPLLKVVNNYSQYIRSVSLVGYSFESLAIGYGDSQTFHLTNGMPGGYENINVKVWDGMHVASNYKFTFADWETTIVYFKY